MERREHKRYFAAFEIELKEAGSDFPARGTTTDVSLGGCYVATIFPLKAGSEVRFSMQVAGETIQGKGTVQTCHPNVGMGIRFVDLSESDTRLLDKYLRASVPFQPAAGYQPYLR